MQTNTVRYRYCVNFYKYLPANDPMHRREMIQAVFLVPGHR
jgi:hypothetical protein